MTPDVHLFITILYEEAQAACHYVVTIDINKLPPEFMECPMEYKTLLWGMLPDHIKSLGPIIKIDTCLIDGVVAL